MRDAGFRRSRLMLIGILAVQASLSLLCIGLFTLDVSGIYAVAFSWKIREILQLLTIVGLLLGSVLGSVLLHAFVHQRREVEARLPAAAGAPSWSVC